MLAILIVLFFASISCVTTFTFVGSLRLKRIDHLKLHSTSRELPDLWKEKIEWLQEEDKPRPIHPENRSMIFTFCSSQVVFPTSVHILDVEENDRIVFENKSKVGIVFSDPSTGYIARVGTMCEIKDQQRDYNNTKVRLTLKGTGRFRIYQYHTLLTNTNSVIQTELQDEINSHEHAVIGLVNDLLEAIKYYAQLTGEFFGDDVAITHFPLLQCWEAFESWNPAVETSTSFSFLVGSFLPQDPLVSQLMLQTTDLEARLRSELYIMNEINCQLDEVLFNMGIHS
eukprot:gene4218-4636_t